MPVVGVGKIGEIFVQRGVDVDDHTTDNTAGIAACTRHLREMEDGLLFANLVDFDSVWGHRNDVEGFAGGLAAVDAALAGWEALLQAEDVMILCADHGVDPTTESTDHSREYSPLHGAGSHAGAVRRRCRRTWAPPRSRTSRARSRRCPGGRSADDDRAEAALRRVAAWRPHAAVVYGSGLGGAAGGRARARMRSRYDELGWPCRRVPGHANVLRLATAPGRGRSRAASGAGLRPPAPLRGLERRGARGAGARLWRPPASRASCSRNSCGGPAAGGRAWAASSSARPVVDLQRPPRGSRAASVCASAAPARRPRASPPRSAPAPSRAAGAYVSVVRPAVRDAGGGRLARRLRRRRGHVGGAGGSRRRRRRRRVLSPGARRQRRGRGRGSHDDVLAAGGRLAALLAGGLTRRPRSRAGPTCSVTR